MIHVSILGISSLISRVSPSFPLSRLSIKVLSTWEGLQACRELSALGVNTLATALHTPEQAILAAECGCMYISPFVHELKAIFDESYDDGGGNLTLCHEIQRYYETHKYSTRVKAAGMLSVEEVKILAGVASMTIAPGLLRTLAVTELVEKDAEESSMFREDNTVDVSELGKKTYIEDEKGWREAYANSYGGKGQWKTNEVRYQFVHDKKYMLYTDTILRPLMYFVPTNRRRSG